MNTTPMHKLTVSLPEKRKYRKSQAKSGDICRPGTKSANIFAADFECATEGAPDAYLCGLVNVFDEKTFWYCDNVPDFVDYLLCLPASSVIYFHNLKYDYSYIFPWLCQAGIRFDEVITGREKKIRQVRIYRDEKYFVELRDSCPMFAPSFVSLKKVMASWCKNHTVKESPGFYLTRPAKVSPEFFFYFQEDVLGLAEALRNRFSLFPEQKTKLTTSSECKDMAKRIINETFSHNKNFFDNVAFPPLALGDDVAMRKYYRGGFVWVNPLHKGKLLTNVEVFDVNSMYPSIMEEELLPYGEPRMFHGKPSENFPLFVVTIRVSWAEVKGDCPAFITNGACNDFGSTEYLEYVGEDAPVEDRTFYLTNMELSRFLENYTYDGLEYLGGFSFKGRNDLFRPYIDRFRSLKETNTGAMREYAKLALNSPSGKWGQNPSVVFWQSVSEDGIQRFKEKEKEREEKAFYLPVSIFTTAYARMRLVDQIKKVGVENAVYTDTDSLHVINYREGTFDLHPTKFGLWDHEKTCEKARYNRQKRYAQIYNGEFHSTVAGIPERYLKQVCNDLETFEPGLQVPCERMTMQAGGMMMKIMNITL